MHTVSKQNSGGYTAFAQADYLCNSKAKNFTVACRMGTQEYDSTGRTTTIQFWKDKCNTSQVTQKDKLITRQAMIHLQNPIHSLSSHLRFNLDRFTQSSKHLGFPCSVFIRTSTGWVLGFSSILFDSALVGGTFDYHKPGNLARLREAPTMQIQDIFTTAWIGADPDSPIDFTYDLADRTACHIYFMGGGKPKPTEQLRQGLSFLTNKLSSLILALPSMSSLHLLFHQKARDDVLKCSSDRLPITLYHNILITNIRSYFNDKPHLLLAELQQVNAHLGHVIAPDKLAAAPGGNFISAIDKTTNTFSIFLPLSSPVPSDEYNISRLTGTRYNTPTETVRFQQNQLFISRIPKLLNVSPQLRIAAVVRNCSADPTTLLVFENVVTSYILDTTGHPVAVAAVTILHRIKRHASDKDTIRFDEEHVLALFPINANHLVMIRSALWGDNPQTILTASCGGVTFQIAPSCQQFKDNRPPASAEGGALKPLTHYLSIATNLNPWNSAPALYDGLVTAVPPYTILSIHRIPDACPTILSSWIVVISGPLPQAVLERITDHLDDVDLSNNCTEVTYSTILPGVADVPIFRQDPVVTRNSNSTKNQSKSKTVVANTDELGVYTPPPPREPRDSKPTLIDASSTSSPSSYAHALTSQRTGSSTSKETALTTFSPSLLSSLALEVHKLNQPHQDRIVTAIKDIATCVDNLHGDLHQDREESRFNFNKFSAALSETNKTAARNNRILSKVTATLFPNSQDGDLSDTTGW